MCLIETRQEKKRTTLIGLMITDRLTRPTEKRHAGAEPATQQQGKETHSQYHMPAAENEKAQIAGASFS